MLTFLVLLFFSFNLNAQLVNIPVTGFTNDLVANGTGATNTVSTGSMAGMVTQPTIGVDGVGYTFIDGKFIQSSKFRQFEGQCCRTLTTTK